MGLTEAEKKAIVDTWGIVRKTPLEAGQALFKLFFEQNPTYKNHFSFRNVETWEELKDDKRLKAHALTVVSALTVMVDSLDQPEVFMELIEKNIRTHINRKIGVEQYKHLKVAFVDTLLAVLGPEIMNEVSLTAWGKAFDVIVETYNKINSQKK